MPCPAPAAAARPRSIAARLRRRGAFCALAILGLAAALGGGAAQAGGWSVAEQAGVHWLVQPDGQRFFSIGVNVVNGGDEDYATRGELAYHWRRHDTSLAAWGARTQRRLQDWGFNTAGGWSQYEVLNLPRIVTTDLGRRARLHWYDIFDDAKVEATNAMAQQLVAAHRGHPLLIGYFSDNEVGWWGSPMFLWHLALGWDKASKRVLWQLLHDTYGGRWERLLDDFVPASPGLDSFAALRAQGAALRLRPGGQGIRVIGAFTRKVAQRYYTLVHDALRRADPQALIVGDRLPLYYNQDAVLALRGRVDVLSTNYNVDVPDGWVAPYFFEGLRDLAGKPVLVSEFFFAADENRSGNANNGHLMNVATQAERVRGAAAALKHFATFPNIVGLHWFQYFDQPTGGRADGEDFNFGLVDLRDRPYEELVATFAALHPQIPAMRAQARWSDRLPQPSPRVLERAPAGLDAADNSLLDWTDKAGTRLVRFATPAPYVPFGDVHVAWSERGLHFFHIGQNHVDLDLLAHDGEFPLSETYRLRFTVDAGAGERRFSMYLAPRPHPSARDRYMLVPQLWRGEGGSGQRLDARGLFQVIDTLLPHVQVEGLIPTGELGVAALRPGQPLRLQVEVTKFYRELTMTLGPAAATLDAAAAAPAQLAPGQTAAPR